MKNEWVFEEATAEARVQSVPLSHLSIELGHLRFGMLETGPEALREHFRQMAPWVTAAWATQPGPALRSTPRISTCLLIDDYFAPTVTPAQILPAVLDAAQESGVSVDYIARQSACVDDEGISLAQLLLDRIVADPVPETNGSRPPVHDIGWLSNGARSPGSGLVDEMSSAGIWAPPVENAASQHSVFIDVELWTVSGGQRVWSTAFLASVWQLLRLGLLRYRGAPVFTPRPVDGQYPDTWHQLPSIIQINERAMPFTAYRTFSVLGRRSPVNPQAIQTILSQVIANPHLIDQTCHRAAMEGIDLSREILDRIAYVVTA